MSWPGGNNSQAALFLKRVRMVVSALSSFLTWAAHSLPLEQIWFITIKFLSLPKSGISLVISYNWIYIFQCPFPAFHRHQWLTMQCYTHCFIERAAKATKYAQADKSALPVESLAWHGLSHLSLKGLRQYGILNLGYFKRVGCSSFYKAYNACSRHWHQIYYLISITFISF